MRLATLRHRVTSAYSVLLQHPISILVGVLMVIGLISLRETFAQNSSISNW